MASEASSVAAGSPGPHGSANDRGDFGARIPRWRPAWTDSVRMLREVLGWSGALPFTALPRQRTTRTGSVRTVHEVLVRTQGCRDYPQHHCCFCWTERPSGPGLPAATALASLASCPPAPPRILSLPSPSPCGTSISQPSFPVLRFGPRITAAPCRKHYAQRLYIIIYSLASPRRAA